jgi:hypothetical protein
MGTEIPGAAEGFVANLVIMSAALRQKSYDAKGAEAAAAAKQRELEKRGFNPRSVVGVDFTQYYKLTLLEACQLVAKEYRSEDLAYPVYLLLQNSWNDALDWATELVAKRTAAGFEFDFHHRATPT